MIKLIFKKYLRKWGLITMATHASAIQTAMAKHLSAIPQLQSCILTPDHERDAIEVVVTFKSGEQLHEYITKKALRRIPTERLAMQLVASLLMEAGQRWGHLAEKEPEVIRDKFTLDELEEAMKFIQDETPKK